MRANIVKGLFLFSGWLLAGGALYAQGGPPSITGLSPTSTQQGTGFTLQVTGSGFSTSGCTFIRFGTTELLAGVVNLGSTQLASANIPASLVSTPGIVQVAVVRYNTAETPSGCETSGLASTPRPFTITPYPLYIIFPEEFQNTATICTPYQLLMEAFGGVPPYSWSATNLPPGITINPSTGLISGSPTTPGQYQAVIRVQDSQQASDQVSLTLTVNGNPLGISTSILPAGSVGTVYTQTLQSQGVSGSPSWSITSNGPPGLSINPSTGVLTGTPTAAGTFQTVFRLSDACRSVTATIPITITGTTLSISNPLTLPAATAGVAYSVTISATGGVQPYSWTASGLPSGLSINTSTGVIGGTTSATGTFNVNVQVNDNQQQSATRTYSLVVNQGAAFTIVTTSIPAATVNVAYSTTLVAQNGIGSVAWSATGLPNGISINPSTGVISGTTASTGTFTVNVQAIDSQQRTATRTLTLQVNSGLSIITSLLPSGRIGQFYEVTMFSSGGVGAVSWSLFSGSLPSGLILNQATGVISGTPALGGEYPFTVRVQDSTGASATRALSISISAGLTILTESPLPPAKAGTFYEASFSATGGVTPYRYLAITALPPGLGLDTFGRLSGTPQQAGSFQFTVQVFDALNAPATKTFELTVVAPFSITTPGLPNGTVGVFYNQTLSTVSGRAPVRWGEESGQLPIGLVLNSNNGGLTGTPQQAGDFTFTVFALDADNQRATKTFTMTIRGNFRITTDSLPNGSVDTAYSQTIATTGGLAPLTFTVAEGRLPDGLTLNRTTGAITGTPVAAGIFTFTVQAGDSGNQSARQSYSVTIIGPPRIVTQSLPAGRQGSAYTAAIEATGGEPPYTFSASGLPDGLSINPSTGEISGTPTRAAAFNMTVTVRDRAGRSVSRDYAVTITAVLTITTSSLPAGTVGTPYSQNLAASGGTGLQWRVSAGSLPNGLSLSSAGAISGTPTSAGNSSFTVEVRDSSNSTATRALAITVNQLTLSPITVSLSLTTAGPTDQPAVRVQITEPAPTLLQGTLNFAFTGVADNKRDAQFSQRDTSFRIPQGQTNAVFAEGLAVQIGTVAGTITITAALTAGGVNVTPSPAPSITINVPRQAPVITSLTARREGSTLTVEAVGYSTTREVTSAELQFAIRQGATVQSTSFTVPLTQPFTTYYGGDSSNQMGGMFRLSLPFTVSGAATDITGVTLTLINSVGRSQSRNADF